MFSWMKLDESVIFSYITIVIVIVCTCNKHLTNKKWVSYLSQEQTVQKASVAGQREEPIVVYNDIILIRCSIQQYASFMSIDG